MPAHPFGAAPAQASSSPLTALQPEAAAATQAFFQLFPQPNANVAPAFGQPSSPANAPPASSPFGPFPAPPAHNPLHSSTSTGRAAPAPSLFGPSASAHPSFGGFSPPVPAAVGGPSSVCLCLFGPHAAARPSLFGNLSPPAPAQASASAAPAFGAAVGGPGSVAPSSLGRSTLNNLLSSPPAHNPLLSGTSTSGRGSHSVPYGATWIDQDGSFISISAMPEYLPRSVEELR